MLKRNGKAVHADHDQLSLFDFRRTHEPANLPDPIRTNGRTSLFEAQETTLDEMEALTRTLETEQGLTMQQAQDQAWEMIREKYILLPPEESLSD
jgi:hypothetical protein